MSIHTTPGAERKRIVFYGRVNAGKSSLINALANQPVSIVSDEEGTTTDPVVKSMEILPLGPVVLVDTPGMNDTTTLGPAREARMEQEYRKADIAVLVADAGRAPDDMDQEWLARAGRDKKPALIALTKSDLGDGAKAAWDHMGKTHEAEVVSVSAVTGQGLHALKEAIGRVRSEEPDRPLVRDLIKPMDLCVLVTPIDAAAPKGRLILPQQQVLRDLLDAGAMAVVVKDTEYPALFQKLAAPPVLVITDSQASGFVSKHTPPNVPLTSFSILFARYKGDLHALVDGARAVMTLSDGDRVLISEGCTHHRQCDDIGTVKIPKWLTDYTGAALKYEFTSGHGYPETLSDYALVVHCGGCMLTKREMDNRLLAARQSGTPIVNYGVLIALMNGVLGRSVEPFGLSIS